MVDNKEFMGRGFSFPLRVDPSTGRIAMCSAEEDIRQAIRIILQTNIGERVMLPEFGTSAGDFIFSDDRAESVTALEESVREALNRWEPRIMNVEVEAENDAGNKNVLEVKISCTIRSTNNQFNMVYPFYVMEGEGR